MMAVACPGSPSDVILPAYIFSLDSRQQNSWHWYKKNHCRAGNLQKPPKALPGAFLAWLHHWVCVGLGPTFHKAISMTKSMIPCSKRLTVLKINKKVNGDTVESSCVCIV